MSATKIIVVGVRSVRQGTGPFVAAALRKAGAEVCAVVGTRQSSVEEARAALQTNFGIECAGYTDLGEALEQEQATAVAICSPYQVHAQQLALVAEAGIHCLVEKPLAWPLEQTALNQLVESFSRRQLLLQVVNQWPFSLAAFAELHGAVPATINDFEMRLSPISIGPTMIADATPHFLGLLQALLGPGQCEVPVITLADPELGQAGLTLSCNYRHAQGVATARLVLQTCEQRPRPAWYDINGLRVEREVELPQYQQYLRANGQRVALSDPMEDVASDFLAKIARNAPTEVELLQQGHANLLSIAAAWPAEA